MESKSASLENCEKNAHKPIQHSPNGIDTILECEKCFKAWLIEGGTGYVMLLPDSWMIRVMRTVNNGR